MSLSVEFVFRMIGMVVVGLLGWAFGGWAGRSAVASSGG